jgi:hypothetical protein
VSTDVGSAGDSVLPQAADLADPRADLESVLPTAELTRRPPRTPDYAAENKALGRTSSGTGPSDCNDNRCNR